MSPNKLGVLASLALAASAVLIPPTITADVGDDMAMEGMVIDSFKRSVTLECLECPLASVESGGLKWKTAAGNAFVGGPAITPIQPPKLTHGSASIS